MDDLMGQFGGDMAIELFAAPRLCGRVSRG